MARPSLVFVGLDAAEPSLLRRWMADGSLPNLAGLCAEGLSGDAVSAEGFGDGVLWTSINTGRAPGNHGRVFNWHLRAGTYALYRYCEDRDLKAPTLWERFSEAGLSCAVVDMVRAKLSPPFNGLQIADWLSHDPIFGARSTPTPLIEDVLKRYGSDPFAPFLADMDKTRPQAEPYLAAALARIEAKTRYVEELLSLDRFDAVFVGYSEAHDIGHALWAYHDPGHPEHDAAFVARRGDPLAETYRALDAALGRLLRRLPPETAVMVLGGPGLKAAYSGLHVLPIVLDRLQHGPPRGAAVVEASLKDAYRRTFPERLRRALRARYRPPRGNEGHHDDWVGQDCFVLPHAETISHLRVNLEGREPRGRVKRVDFDAYRASLSRDLLDLVDPDTGKPAVDRVVDLVRAHPGDNRSEMPDLAVYWSTERPIRGVSSPKIGTVRGDFWSVRTGDHNNACFFALRAPGTPHRALSEPADYLDVAATLPRLAGTSLGGFDGRPLPLT